ncbi:MAG: hypothetical protein ACO29O_03910 [Chitinophagaceae bacterium]
MHYVFNTSISILFIILFHGVQAQKNNLDIKIQERGTKITNEGAVILATPQEGQWSIATDWNLDQPDQWHHAQVDTNFTQGEWTIVQGLIKLPEGNWILRDAFKREQGKIKCIRRFEWKGQQALPKVTLSVRWVINAIETKAFLPGIIYYGNPSGEKNGKENVASYHGKPGEFALFEEHRYPMPFACTEWNIKDKNYAAALHSIPSPVFGGNHFDQWWSLGLKTNEKNTELLMLSGPIGYNGKYSVAKALQNGSLPYGDTYINIKPGTVIEKIFYLEANLDCKKGAGFQPFVHSSIEIFQPFSLDAMPTAKNIIADKIKFAKSRWVENEKSAGFNMYPSFVKPQIVLGWAGQSEAPGYALQILSENTDTSIRQMVQKSLDHISSLPVGADGFPVVYDLGKNLWSNPDPVSEGQAMGNVAMAIKAGRANKNYVTKKWELFLRKACDVHSKRILDSSWKPVNTAEAFFIMPLMLSSKLFSDQHYLNAALKAAEYYGNRHLNMDEPYWGGTLDATCEDKEGAWGAFQGFLAAYEFTGKKKYLDWSKHAADVILSYTAVWDIPLPAGRLADHGFKSRGWTMVSAQNQHLDVFGVIIAPSIYRLGKYLGDLKMQQLAVLMYRSCGQLIDAFGSQGEQIQHTNFAQHGDMSDVYKLRGGYSESWTVFWITAHFLNAAAQFKEMGVNLDKPVAQ